MQKRATTHPKIEIIWNSQVKEAKGDGKSLTSLTLENTTNGQKKNFQLADFFMQSGINPIQTFSKEFWI